MPVSTRSRVRFASRAWGWYGVEFLVGQVRERTEGVLTVREPLNHLRGADTPRGAAVVVNHGGVVGVLGAAMEDSRDPHVGFGGVQRDGGDGAVAELVAAPAGALRIASSVSASDALSSLICWLAW